MKRAYGFTLVELLVVIAIISILAGIVIPNVPKYINKARATRAFAEIKGIDLALTKMLTDAGRSDFQNGFFDSWPAESFADAVRANGTYETVFYLLLRKGKYADGDGEWPLNVQLNPEVKRKLGDSYMDLGKDPWGNLYHIVPGPFNYPDFINPGNPPAVQFRIYQLDTNSDTAVPGSVTNDLAWNPNGIRTVTDPDDPNLDPFEVGFPAPRKQVQYVWSDGKNRVTNQQFSNTYGADPAEVGLDFIGGGDDINNWDGDTSWLTFYN
ncbi:MAG: type II secretion system protein [Candidatus Hydrogenedentes bacterium]|nr:type II secretion system protein [Candidatus Hydrogenedentota bacterium]